ncbi:MAG: hypothetical protein ACI8RZ_008086 [Myxococcota bacterium]|jgi:hypothetical protein
MPLPRSRRLLWAAFSGLLICSLACSGVDTQECIGSVVTNGQTYQPQSGVSDPVAAQRMACNQYCLSGDPEYEAMYGIWTTSPSGDPGVSREEAIYRDERLLDYVTGTCADRCVAAVAAGQMQGNVTCR